MDLKQHVGKVVMVEFLDHVEDGKKPIKFIVYGELSVVEQESICVDCWAYANRKKKYDQNEKRFTVVTSCITRFALLDQREVQ